MATQFEPTVGDWYKTTEGLSFEVIAVDDDEGSIEVQYFDGAVEELDSASWYDMEVSRREPPEDWSGPFDDLERDDFGDNGDALRPQEYWSGPLDTLDWED